MDKVSQTMLNIKYGKNYADDILSYAEMAWESYEKYMCEKTNENLESFRFYFNYFYNNNKEVAETDMMYGENVIRPRYKFVAKNNPVLAKSILKSLDKRGIDFKEMEGLYLSIEDERYL